jgi:DNA-binding NarL/FixJ family response regulator
MTDRQQPDLSDEEVRLLQMLAEGLTVEAVARHLDLSERTVRRRQRAICDRLEVDACIQAVVWAAKRGVV